MKNFLLFVLLPFTVNVLFSEETDFEHFEHPKQREETTYHETHDFFHQNGSRCYHERSFSKSTTQFD